MNYLGQEKKRDDGVINQHSKCPKKKKALITIRHAVQKKEQCFGNKLGMKLW